MRTYFINAEVDDDIFSYWTAYTDFKSKTKISELINLLEGSERLNVGDIISIEFDTKRMGFDRNFHEDYNAFHFKLDHKKFQYMFHSSNDELDLFEEYVIVPIQKNIND